MSTTMDQAGRLVIPADVRRDAGLEPGTPLDVRWRDGIIEIEPRPVAVKLERRGRLLVATSAKGQPRLTGEIVERTRRSLAKRGGA
jgi:AbrB family looped-hinge helix DNA binding protein